MTMKSEKDILGDYKVMQVFLKYFMKLINILGIVYEIIS